MQGNSFFSCISVFDPMTNYAHLHQEAHRQTEDFPLHLAQLSRHCELMPKMPTTFAFVGLMRVQLLCLNQIESF